MSKHLLSFFLSELNTVRVICQKCQTVTEVSMDTLATKSIRNCPICNADFGITDDNSYAALKDMGRAIRQMSDPLVSKHVKIEFVIPDKSTH